MRPGGTEREAERERESALIPGSFSSGGAMPMNISSSSSLSPSRGHPTHTFLLPPLDERLPPPPPPPPVTPPIFAALFLNRNDPFPFPFSSDIHSFFPISLLLSFLLSFFLSDLRCPSSFLLIDLLLLSFFSFFLPFVLSLSPRIHHDTNLAFLAVRLRSATSAYSFTFPLFSSPSSSLPSTLT